MNKEIIEKAVQTIKKGGTLLCPTDTIWGISADACNEKAVDKIFQLKNRPKNKSAIVLVNSIEMLAKYVEEIPEIVKNKLKTIEKPTTFIYPKALGLPKNVVASNGSIGIRIVKNGFCYELIKQLGRPIVSTSANISNETSPSQFSEINPIIIKRVDFCVPQSEESHKVAQASSIYLIEREELKQIR